jgi:O-antigen/teichoic acid export membrane protein|tara:strand:- start:525 stop:1721 length:1197 start_codon:yes stop_codon:yes gene_type:complete
MKLFYLLKAAVVNSSVQLLFRISSLILAIMLIKNLNIEDFANFQIIKNAIGYLLISMEFGFFHFGNTLFNKDLYRFKSILFSFIKLRILVFLIFFPLIFLYFYLIQFSKEIIFFSSIICFFLIISYEGALITINKNLQWNLIFLFKTLLFLFLVFVYKNDLNLQKVLIFFIYSIIFSIIIQYLIYLSFKDKNIKVLKNRFLEFALKAKNYFIISLSNHFTVYLGLTIAPFLISKNEIANYAILLLVLEVLLIPLFQLQKIIMPDYSKVKDKQMILKSLTLFLIALVVGLFIHYFFGNFFFNLLLNDKYPLDQIIRYVYFLFPIALLRGLTTMINLYYYYNNYILFQRKISLITASLSLFIFLILGKSLGLYGLILSLFFVELLFLILSSKFIIKFIRS